MGSSFHGSNALATLALATSTAAAAATAAALATEREAVRASVVKGIKANHKGQPTPRAGGKFVKFETAYSAEIEAMVDYALASRARRNRARS